jgi:hypothetical protein
VIFSFIRATGIVLSLGGDTPPLKDLASDTFFVDRMRDCLQAYVLVMVTHPHCLPYLDFFEPFFSVSTYATARSA